MSELLGAFGGTRPLRRPLPSRRRKRTGMAALLAGALVRAVLLVGVPVAVVVWLLYSPYFLIREVEVEGGSRVSAAWVQDTLRPLSGRHILGVSLEGVRHRLSAHPWVASVELRRELPDRLRVSVVERQPAALLAVEGGLEFLDAAGETIAPSPESGVAGLLVVHYPFAGPVPVGEVLDVVGELQRSDPVWGLGVREVKVLGEGEFRLTSEPLPFPLLVKAGEVGEGVANLRQVLPEVTRRWQGIGSVDLRQPRRLVVQHAGEVPPQPRPKVPAALPGPVPLAADSPAMVAAAPPVVSDWERPGGSTEGLGAGDVTGGDAASAAVGEGPVASAPAVGRN